MAEVDNRPVTDIQPKRKAPKTAFRKGSTGNPHGRPKILKDIQALCRQSTPDNVKTLIQLTKAADSDAARIAAIKLLWAYGYGQPQQSVTLTQPNQHIVVTFGNLDPDANKPATTSQSAN